MLSQRIFCDLSTNKQTELKQYTLDGGSLTIGLLVVGGVLLLALIIWKWVTRKKN